MGKNTECFITHWFQVYLLQIVDQTFLSALELQINKIVYQISDNFNCKTLLFEKNNFFYDKQCLINSINCNIDTKNCHWFQLWIMWIMWMGLNGTDLVPSLGKLFNYVEFLSNFSNFQLCIYRQKTTIRVGIQTYYIQLQQQ